MSHPAGPVGLEDVIDEIIRRHPRDSRRLDPLADYAVRRFADYGLPDVRGGTGGELLVRGLARGKRWDVAHEFAGKNRLLVSLKSIWQNAGGTVPNRLDDLMGEVANVQQMSPEIVIGYILLFDARADARRKSDNRYWSEYFEDRVRAIAIRRAPLWNQGLLEGTWFIKFDSAAPRDQRIVDPAKVAAEESVFFLSLLRELKRREPAIPFTREISDESGAGPVRPLLEETGEPEGDASEPEGTDAGS